MEWLTGRLFGVLALFSLLRYNLDSLRLIVVVVVVIFLSLFFISMIFFCLLLMLFFLALFFLFSHLESCLLFIVDVEIVVVISWDDLLGWSRLLVFRFRVNLLSFRSF